MGGFGVVHTLVFTPTLRLPSGRPPPKSNHELLQIVTCAGVRRGMHDTHDTHDTYDEYSMCGEYDMYDRMICIMCLLCML